MTMDEYIAYLRKDKYFVDLQDIPEDLGDLDTRRVTFYLAGALADSFITPHFQVKIDRHCVNSYDLPFMWPAYDGVLAFLYALDQGMDGAYVEMYDYPWAYIGLAFRRIRGTDKALFLLTAPPDEEDAGYGDPALEPYVKGWTEFCRGKLLSISAAKGCLVRLPQLRDGLKEKFRRVLGQQLLGAARRHLRKGELVEDLEDALDVKREVIDRINDWNWMRSQDWLFPGRKWPEIRPSEVASPEQIRVWETIWGRPLDGALHPGPMPELFWHHSEEEGQDYLKTFLR